MFLVTLHQIPRLRNCHYQNLQQHIQMRKKEHLITTITKSKNVKLTVEMLIKIPLEEDPESLLELLELLDLLLLSA